MQSKQSLPCNNNNYNNNNNNDNNNNNFSTIYVFYM